MAAWSRKLSADREDQWACTWALTRAAAASGPNATRDKSSCRRATSRRRNDGGKCLRVVPHGSIRSDAEQEVLRQGCQWGTLMPGAAKTWSTEVLFRQPSVRGITTKAPT